MPLVLSPLLLLALSAPPAGAPVRVMAVGDSVTESNAGHASWRYWLWKHLEEKGDACDLVGSMNGVFGGPPLYSDFDADHEAHSGWHCGEMAAAIAGFATAAQPGVALIHMGNTDLVHAVPIPTAIVDLGAIVDNLRAIAPGAVVLLAQVIPTGSGDQALASVPYFNATVALLAANRDRPEARVLLVDQYTGFDPAVDCYDPLHPSESGEKKMAARWEERLDPVLAALSPPGFSPGATLQMHDAAPGAAYATTFDGVAGMTLKLEIQNAHASAAAHLEVRDAAGSIVADSTIDCGKKSVVKLTVAACGRHSLRLDGFTGNVAKLRIETARKLPAAAKDQKLTVSAPPGEDAAGLDVVAFPGAHLDATLAPVQLAGEAEVVLHTPDGAALDVTEYAVASGGSFELVDLPLLLSGTYRLEVLGLAPGAGKVKFDVRPIQPGKGKGKVEIAER